MVLSNLDIISNQPHPSILAQNFPHTFPILLALDLPSKCQIRQKNELLNILHHKSWRKELKSEKKLNAGTGETARGIFNVIKQNKNDKILLAFCAHLPVIFWRKWKFKIKQMNGKNKFQFCFAFLLS